MMWQTKTKLNWDGMTNSDRPKRLSIDFLSRIHIMMSQYLFIWISGANKNFTIIGDACLFLYTIDDAFSFQICQIVRTKILQKKSDALISKKKINYDAGRQHVKMSRSTAPGFQKMGANKKFFLKNIIMPIPSTSFFLKKIVPNYALGRALQRFWTKTFFLAYVGLYWQNNRQTLLTSCLLFYF